MVLAVTLVDGQGRTKAVIHVSSTNGTIRIADKNEWH
jgi:hypothetical protein